MNLPWGEPYYVLRHLARPQALFSFDGKMLPYFIHFYHGTYRNERCVEVPIALSFVQPHMNILEVGNVLNHYIALPHQTVDKYERYPGVINEDIVLFSPDQTYDLILSISTLEHIGWDETPREPEKIHDAMYKMRSWLKPNGHLVFTIPIGWNKYLDRLVFDGQFPMDASWFLRRTNVQCWEPCGMEHIRGARFGAPFYCANAVMIGLCRR